MKILIGILGCKRERFMNQVIRETWLELLPFVQHRYPHDQIEYRFFLGRGNEDPQPDEVILDADDSAHGLTEKVQTMFNWSLDRNVDYLYRCDNDTYVCLPRLLRSDFARYNVMNRYGGCGIWLSQKAMSHLVMCPLQDRGLIDDHWITDNYGLDFQDERYATMFGDGPTLHNDSITLHHDQWNSLRYDDATAKALIARHNAGQHDSPLPEPSGDRMRAAHFFAKEIV